MANLYVMAGPPGSGKSTFLKNKINTKNSIIVSRDVIRFSIVKPEEDYFSHEDEVLQTFWKQINEGLAIGKNVYVDQTSLTPKARKLLLNNINGYERAIVIWIDEDLEICLARNEMRRGTRSYVPEQVVRRMYAHFIEPSFKEDFDTIYRYNSKKDKIAMLYTVQEKGEIV